MPRIASTHDIFDQLKRIFPDLPQHIVSLDLHIDVNGNPPTLKVEIYPADESGDIISEKAEVKVFDIVERPVKSEQLTTPQKLIIDGMPIQAIESVISDFDQSVDPLSYSDATYGLAMSVEFMDGSFTQDELVEYCRESISKRTPSTQ